MKTVTFYTLGCKVNQYESEAMEEAFLDRGYRAVGRDEGADVFVINTCTVTHVADAKCRQAIRRAKRKNPQAVVAVVGCYVQVAPETVRAIKGVDVLIGTKGRDRIVDAVEEVSATGKKVEDVVDLDRVRRFDELGIATELSTTRAAIKVQEGCEMYCSYCIIPYARGHMASRDQGAILDEVRRLVRKGIKEYVLTGIHVASYGKEKAPDGQVEAERPRDLIDLVEAVAKIPGVERIRLSSIEPRWVTPEKLLRLAACGKFADHFHLSLQSGSDRILKAMNRKYDKALYLEKIREIRKVFPHAGLTTDVIVGFPGEIEEDFRETLAFVEEVGFSKIHIFPYSKREGTPAALFRNQVPPSIKKDRAARLAEREIVLRHAFMDRMEGEEVRVLFEEGGDKGNMEGYTGNYLRVRMKRKETWVNRIISGRIGKREGDVLHFEPEQ